MNRQAAFFRAGGTMEPTAPNYIERAADKQLLEALLAREYVFLLDSRQKGKSSLVARTIHKLREKGIRTVKLDLQWLGANVTPEQWYAGLLSEIGLDLGLESELLEYWNSHQPIGPLSRWIGALRDVVLAKVTDPLVIFIDEIDFVRALPFPTDEFFAGIRDCYNRRSTGGGFDRLTFCIAGVATPGQLIRNPEITPFNVGMRVDLSDFTLDETLTFARELTTSERDGNRLLRRVHYWVNGHPYLTQLLCGHIASDESVRSEQGVDRLVEKLFLTPEARQREPNFADIERRVLDPDVPGLSPEERRTQVLDLYGRLLKGKHVEGTEENPVVATLRLSGLGLEDRGALRLRNRTYRTVFNEGWRLSSLPDAELRRQRGAARVAILRTAAVAGVVVLAISSAAVGILSISKERERALLALKQKTRDLSKTSDERKDALTLLEARNKELNRISGERKRALETLGQRSEDLKRLSDRQRDTLTLLSRINKDLKKTSLDKERALLEVQKGAVDLSRQRYSVLVGTILRSQSARAAELFFKAQRSPFRGWEWGHLGLQFERPEMEASFTQNGRFESQPEGTVMAVSSRGLFEVGPTGVTLRNPFPQIEASSSNKELPAPAPRVGHCRIWWSDYQYSILDSETHQVIVPYQKERIEAVNPNARTYLMQDEKAPESFEVRAMDGRQLLASHKGPGLGRGACFLPDGTIISAHGDWEGKIPLEVHRWDLSGKVKVVRPALGAYRLLVVSPDGSKYAICEDRKGEIRRASDDAVLSTLPELPDFIQAVVFSPDAGKLLVGCADGGVRLYETDTAKLLKTFVDQWVIFDVAFLPDGKHIASLGENIKVWSLESRPAVETYSDSVSLSAFVSGNGKSLITQSKDLTISSRNLLTGTISKRDAEPPGVRAHLTRCDETDQVFMGLPGGRVTRLDPETLKEEAVEQVFPSGQAMVKVLLGGKRLLAGAVDESKGKLDCAILDAKSLTPTARFRLNGSDKDLFVLNPFISYSRDGSHFAIAPWEGSEVRVYSATDGSLLRSITTDLPVYAISLSRDGRKVAVSLAQHKGNGEERVDLFDTGSGKRTGSLTGSGDAPLAWMDYSPNGEFLAGVTYNETGHLWNLRSRQEVATLPRAMGNRYVRFSPDGERLITSGRFQNIGIWDGRTGAEMMTLKYQARGRPYRELLYDDARFTADGRSIVVRCIDGTVQIYNSLPWKDQPKTARK